MVKKSKKRTFQYSVWVKGKTGYWSESFHHKNISKENANSFASLGKKHHGYEGYDYQVLPRGKKPKGLVI